MTRMRTRMTSISRNHQRGITLVIGLIMLVLLTMMAITAFHLGTSQTVIVSNAQHRNEAIDAAQRAIDTVLNSNSFMVNPNAAISSSSCSGSTLNTLCVDVNGDGTPDVTVALTPKPKCISGAPIANGTLDFSKTDDLACAAGTQQSFGVAGSTSGNSLCAQSAWEVTAVASDTTTNTNVTIVQGVAARVATTDLTNNCN